MVVEDEALSRLYLTNLLTQHSDIVSLVASVSTEDEAAEAISLHRPHLLLLDIELQQGSGFAVLNRIDGQDPYIVFTTAFDDRVLNAIRFSGTEFLQKPIDMEALAGLLGRLSVAGVMPVQPSLFYLRETLANNYQPVHIAVSTSAGIIYLRITDIIRMEAIDQSTLRCVVKDRPPLVIQANMNEMAMLMGTVNFYRVHLAHLVNLSMIETIGHGSVRMINQEVIPLSPKKEQQVRDLLANL